MWLNPYSEHSYPHCPHLVHQFKVDKDCGLFFSFLDLLHRCRTLKIPRFSKFDIFFGFFPQSYPHYPQFHSTACVSFGAIFVFTFLCYTRLTLKNVIFCGENTYEYYYD